MTPREILIAARAKIEKPECWTQAVSARNVNGRPVLSWGTAAVCWCSTGAIVSQSENSPGAQLLALRALSRAMGNTSEAIPGIQDYNDSSTHAEVLAAFDRAIASLEEQS